MEPPKQYAKRILLALEQADYDHLVKVWLDGGPSVTEQIRQAIKKVLCEENKCQELQT